MIDFADSLVLCRLLLVVSASVNIVTVVTMLVEKQKEARILHRLVYTNAVASEFPPGHNSILLSSVLVYFLIVDFC